MVGFRQPLGLDDQIPFRQLRRPAAGRALGDLLAGDERLGLQMCERSMRSIGEVGVLEPVLQSRQM